MTNLLLLEDDVKMAAEIKRFLEHQGYACTAVHDGLKFLEQSAMGTFQLYILDINVPSLNGVAVCKHIRQTDSQTPILMLTAYSSVEDKVDALNSGADDYLVKPFSLEELNARVRALLRRTAARCEPESETIMVADLVINTTELRVLRGTKEIPLTPKEYKLLETLAQARGRVLSKQQIAEMVWDINFETGTNTIEVYISFLRSKIDNGFDHPLIHTRPGYGYYLKETK